MVRKFFKEEHGPTATEYAICLAGIIVIAFLSIGVFGEEVSGLIDNIVNQMF